MAGSVKRELRNFKKCQEVSGDNKEMSGSVKRELRNFRKCNKKIKICQEV